MRTYGKLHYDADVDKFVLQHPEPHVSIKLKNVFPGLSKTQTKSFYFRNVPEVLADLHWFMQRYPFQISKCDSDMIQCGKISFEKNIAELDAISLPDYKATIVRLKAPHAARQYQVQGKDTYLKAKRLLLGDDLGLGKTLTSILSFLHPETLPALVVVQTHMPNQWKVEQIERFTDLQVHVIKGTKPYNLPQADVYIMKYSCMIGWVDILGTGFFKSVVFDECQELRRNESRKYEAAQVISNNVQYCLGLSATPIYNFGDEIFNVLNIIKPWCLGSREEFLREWSVPHGQNNRIKDPKALGSFLREHFLFLRRTRSEVGRELPPLNKIVHTVGYDEGQVKKSEQLAKDLAQRVVSGSFTERGQAALELDMLARYTTGISKAREVANYVRILLENDEPVVLAGWHRDVYDIWLKELEEFKPVMYTGTESGTQKEKAKKAFMDGETNLFILSLRSGAGLDGLQHRCKTVVFGELDWSPKVHDQLVGRVDRDGQQEQVTAIYLVSESGSDPVIINLLGLKASQSMGIVDPLSTPAEQYSDESRMKQLAAQYLNKQVA